LTTEEYPYEEDPLLGGPTMNIGTIQGGIKVNVVPDACEAQLDMRIVKGQTPEMLLSLMNDRLKKSGLEDRVSVEYLLGKPPVLTPRDSTIAETAVEVVAKVTGTSPTLATATYGTDCSVLQPMNGILNIICGPGSIEQAHQPDEYIRLDELYKSVEVYLQIARRFDH
jgi:succinyl-diaminopimelate desuccinylase